MEKSTTLQFLHLCFSEIVSHLRGVFWNKYILLDHINIVLLCPHIESRIVLPHPSRLSVRMSFCSLNLLITYVTSMKLHH